MGFPERLSEYRERSYWDARYQRYTHSPLPIPLSKGTSRSSTEQETYDWLVSYENLKQLMCQFLTPKDLRILILGCGNSKLSEDLYADGYTNIMNIDYSPPVIATMRERTKDLCPQMSWHVMDMRDLSSLESGSFDLVIDKGSLDAIWSDGGSPWDPSTTVRNDIGQSVDETVRVLRPRGAFVSISFVQPHFRKPLIERPEQWTLKYEPIPDTIYFLYYAIKH